MMCLVDINPGQHAIVTGISQNTQLRRRLQDLGIISGTTIECIGKSPFGDPTAYLIRKTVIALRKEDAKHIFIREVGTWKKS